MRRASLLILITLLMTSAAFAQAPAAPPQTAAPKPAAPAGVTGGIAVIDFMKAVTGNGQGTMATNVLMAENNKRMALLQAKQKEGQDAQTQLTTQDKVLSEARKAELTRIIDRVQTDITRMQDDFNKEMQDLQQTNLAPVAAIVRGVMEKYAAEKGFALVLDIGGDANNVVFSNPGVDITQEGILQADAQTPRAGAPRPATGLPAAAPKPPATPPPAPKPPVPDPSKKP